MSTDTPTCRRCGRVLTAPLAVLAGYGEACARRKAAEAAMAAPTAAQTAVALISAHAQRVDQDAFDAVLEGADTAKVAGLLAAGAAIVLGRLPGGSAWIEGLGLAAAQEAGPQ